MADGYDRYDSEGGGGSFVIGLLTGTVLGAGLGMLFAPRAGAELRNKISEQAGNLKNTASEGYRKASEKAENWAEKGRDMGRNAYDKTREAVTRGVDEAERYVRETADAPVGTTSSSASSYGDGDPSGGSAPDVTLGAETTGAGRSGARRRS